MSLTEADKKLIKAGLDVISEHFTNIEDEKEMVKGAIEDMSEQFGLDKKTIRKIAKTYHKQTFVDERKDFESFENLYEELTSVE